jgi:hypothetical protein
MTLKEQATLLGPALLRTEGMLVPVEVSDVRLVFGRLDVYVHPAGLPKNGGKWIDRNRVVVNVPDDSEHYGR